MHTPVPLTLPLPSQPKHILHESLSHHHMLPAALLCPSPPPLAAATVDMQGTVPRGRAPPDNSRPVRPLDLPHLLQATKALHVDHQRDASDLCMMAYERGTLSKVVEFVDFEERLERSYVRAASCVEHALLDLRTALLQGGPLPAVAVRAADHAARALARVSSPAACCFNEDWSTRPCWLPPATVGGPWALLQWWDTCPGQALGACCKRFCIVQTQRHHPPINNRHRPVLVGRRNRQAPSQ